MPARCMIDGSEVPLATVMKRVMNFGQPIAGLAPLPYTIVVPREELLAMLAEPHAQTMRELIDDGEEMVAEWPSPDYIKTYLAAEMLDALATSAPPGAFQLNTLDDVIVDGDEIELRGECYRL